MLRDIRRNIWAVWCLFTFTRSSQTLERVLSSLIFGHFLSSGSISLFSTVLILCQVVSCDQKNIFRSFFSPKKRHLEPNVHWHPKKKSKCFHSKNTAAAQQQHRTCKWPWDFSKPRLTTKTVSACKSNVELLHHHRAMDRNALEKSKQ